MRPRWADKTVRAGTCWALALLALLATPACAQQLSLQTQLEYGFIQRKGADGHTESFGRASPLYIFTVRGPLHGGLNVLLDLGLVGYSSGDPHVSVDQRNLRLNLLAQGTRLNLVATAVRDRNWVTFDGPDGRRRTSLASSDNYGITGILAYPAYPTVSLQYQRTALGGDGGSQGQVSTQLLGANYEWGPVRFLVDQVKQDAGVQGYSTQTRRYGVSFNQSLLPTVRLSIDHYSTFADNLDQSLRSSSTGRTTTARVSAMPTPFLVVDGELSLTGSSQRSPLSASDGSGLSHALYLRSEVFPGIRLDVMRQGQSARSSPGRFSTGLTAANLAVQLHPTTSLLVNWSGADAHDALGQSAGEQQNHHVALSTALSPVTGMFVDYGRATRTFQSARSTATGAVLGVRTDPSPSFSLEMSYRRDQRNDAGLGGAVRSLTDGLQVDATWLPHQLWGLTLGVGVIRANDDGRQSLSLAPTVETRWDMDAATSLALRYNVYRAREEFDAIDGTPGTFRSSATGLTWRLTHQLGNGGTLEANYDFQKTFGGPFIWQKVLRIRYSRSF